MNTFAIINKGKTEDEAEILIYDVIGESMFEESTSAKSFVKNLQALKGVKNINLRINSPGGSVFDGSAIYNAIKAHPANVVAHVDGFAASAASWIALAADEVVMAENAMMMIHDPQGFAMGDAENMRKQADTLDKIKDTIVKTYQNKTGRDAEEISDAMSEETWYNAEEAVEFGLADRISEDGPKVTNLSPEFVAMLTDYAQVPEAVINIATDAGTSRQPTTDNKESDMDPKILMLLGLPETATQEEYDTALDAHIASHEAANQGGETTPDAETTVAPVPAVAPATTNALPEGMVAVDEATLTNLAADAKAGRDARDEQVKNHRNAVIKNALADGKFPVEREAHWRNQLDLDPGVEKVINEMPKGLCVPVGDQVSGGNVNNLNNTNTDNAYPAEWLTEGERARIANNNKEA